MIELSDFQQKIAAFLPETEICFEESLAKHTSFRIGGPAEVMVFPKDQRSLSKALEVSKLLDCKPFILGAGTNVLAPDEGLRGIVICLKDCLEGIQIMDGCRLRVSAGVTMTRAAVFAANQGLGGMEFAHGIPGTVGGGVYMNAGAYGGEIAGICESVDIMTSEGEIKTLTSEEMEFSYRHSCLQNTDSIALSAVFALREKPISEIRGKMQELMAKRKASQPLEYPSAGSAFKRPSNGYAAALIDQAGLKGFRIGNAAVSEKHAGFVVNLGGATAADVQAVLASVADRVYAASGIYLEPEIRIL